MKVFGIDPGSARTGYGCVQSDGSRHRMIVCGAITIPVTHSFPEKLRDHPRRARHPDCPAPARRCRHRKSVSRRQREKRAEARACPRRRDARGRRSRRADRRIHARGSEAVGGRIRPRGKRAGAVDGSAAARPQRAAHAVRRLRRARDCRLSSSPDEPARRGGPAFGRAQSRQAARRAGAPSVFPAK